MISFVWAMDKNGVIGYENKLPWRLPEDLKFFKETTMGHPIVMGRKTFESIGRPLPGRENIILTRDASYEAEGCIVYHDIKEVLHHAEEMEVEVMVTGGAEIFEKFIPYADKLYVTRIYETFEGDTYFPDLNWDEYELISTKQGVQNEQNPYHYVFEVYKKK
ncbi:dihydrofolate reductase [Rossellomorea vietnamensis]|uniref:Dihydrofolate reductase n=2 Tax=Rossellomorea vietnamensis TaxID=218284 RepID=A0A5D4NX65_9BACI|nr:dihydrofolate reductase [Rossellomorea vietnamensis]TYS18847.1 dihydrofolate reductase [Rossellomorea vietnamensis]